MLGAVAKWHAWVRFVAVIERHLIWSVLPHPGPLPLGEGELKAVVVK